MMGNLYFGTHHGICSFVSITDPTFLAMLKLQRAEYRRALPQRLAHIESLWHQVLGGNDAAQALATLERSAHSLAGSGATFGCAGAGSAARELELAVAPLVDTACAMTAGKRLDISLAIEVLRRSLPGDATNRDGQA